MFVATSVNGRVESHCPPSQHMFYLALFPFCLAVICFLNGNMIEDRVELIPPKIGRYDLGGNATSLKALTKETEHLECNEWDRWSGTGDVNFRPVTNDHILVAVYYTVLTCE